jgi:hypothetical protein
MKKMQGQTEEQEVPFQFLIGMADEPWFQALFYYDMVSE